MNIITPSRNGVRFIADAIQSVRQQHYPNLKHIVLDACSTDGTLALLARYPEIAVNVEPDDSAHHAMNKGVALAEGGIIGFLNTDDLYPDGALLAVGRIFATHPDIDVVIGNSILFEDDGCGRRRILVTRTHERENGLWLPELTFGSPGFNGCFYRRSVFDQIGGFETSYSFAADKHFLVRMALAGLKSVWIDTATIWYRVHPDSRTFNPGFRFLLPISWELFAMAAEFAQLAKGRPDVRRVFLAWHAFEGAKLILRNELRGSFGEALDAFVRLGLNNPLWPIRLARAIALRHAIKKAYASRLPKTVEGA